MKREVTELEEQVARVIARKLGHNDETGMYWERYICAAQGIVNEFLVRQIKQVA